MDVLLVLGSALGGGLIGAGAMAWLAIRQFRSVVGEIRVVRDRIPASDQAWFWTEEWQAGEAEAELTPQPDVALCSSRTWSSTHLSTLGEAGSPV